MYRTFAPNREATILASGLSGLQAIISDYDDCMAPTERHCLGRAAYPLAQDTLGQRNMHMPYTKEQFINTFPGMQFRHILEHLADELGFSIDAGELDKLAKEEIDLVMDVLHHHLKPMPFCDSALELFRLLGLRFAVASSSARRRLAVCIDTTGQSEWVSMDLVTSAQDQDVNKPKPKPDVWLKAMKKLNSTALNTVAIEDSPSGVESAVAAGLPTIGLLQAVRKGRTEREHLLRERGASVVLNSWAEVAAVITCVHAHFS